MTALTTTTTTGPFLTAFRAKYPTYPITAFLRTTSLDPKLRALNITPVLGTFDDLSTIEKLASQHDVVINAATSMNTDVTQAILRGVAAGQDAPKKTLIHLSGTGNFVDERHDGKFVEKADDEIWNDANPEHVKRISKEMSPNGPCDELILRAAAKGEVNAYIVCPAGIYGNGTNNALEPASGPLPPGVWVSWMMQNIETLGYSPYIGDGTSLMGLVHVDDVVTLMMLVFERVVRIGQSYKAEDVWSNFFVAYDEGKAWKKLAELFAELMGSKAKKVNWEDAGIVQK